MVHFARLCLVWKGCGRFVFVYLCFGKAWLHNVSFKWRYVTPCSARSGLVRAVVEAGLRGA